MLDIPPDIPPDAGDAARPRRPGRRAVADSATASSHPITPGVLFGILSRHQWLPIASVLLIPAAMGLALQVTTPRYSAIGALLYDPPAYRLAELQSILRVDPISDDVMASQAEVMRGLRIVQRMATQLNLFDDPEFNGALRPASLPARAMGHRGMACPRPPPAPAPARAQAQAPAARPQGNRHGNRASDPGNPDGTDKIAGPQLDDVRNSVLLAVQQALLDNTTHGSRVVTVTLTAQNRVLAAAAVNAIMDLYIKDQLGAKYRAVREANDWPDTRVAELRNQMPLADDHVAAYRASRGLIQGMHACLDAEKVSHLTEGLVQAHADLAAAEARVDAVRGQAGASAFAAIAPSVIQLDAQQNQLRVQFRASMPGSGPTIRM
jgi:succinoglycan biosynthesis transport protein ExoP